MDRWIPPSVVLSRILLSLLFTSSVCRIVVWEVWFYLRKTEYDLIWQIMIFYFFTRPILPLELSGIGLCMYVCMCVRYHFVDDHYFCSQTTITIHILKAYDESYSKIIRGHRYIYKDNEKTTTTTKTKTKCLKNPTCAIFLKSWWLTHSKYDDRYLNLVILFTPVALVTLFRSYNQFYRAECITVSGFFFFPICQFVSEWLFNFFAALM